MQLLRSLTLVSLVSTSALCACSKAPPPPPFKVVADTKLLMKAVLEPEANAIANAFSGGEEGPESASPAAGEQWVEVRNAAVALAESGNLLMMAPRARDGGDWMLAARALVDVGESAMLAAERKDSAALSELGERVYGVCSDCHQKYPPQTSARH